MVRAQVPAVMQNGIIRLQSLNFIRQMARFNLSLSCDQKIQNRAHDTEEITKYAIRA